MSAPKGNMEMVSSNSPPRGQARFATMTTAIAIVDHLPESEMSTVLLESQSQYRILEVIFKAATDDTAAKLRAQRDVHQSIKKLSEQRSALEGVYRDALQQTASPPRSKAGTEEVLITPSSVASPAKSSKDLLSELKAAKVRVDELQQQAQHADTVLQEAQLHHNYVQQLLQQSSDIINAVQARIAEALPPVQSPEEAPSSSVSLQAVSVEIEPPAVTTSIDRSQGVVVGGVSLQTSLSEASVEQLRGHLSLLEATLVCLHKEVEKRAQFPVPGDNHDAPLYTAASLLNAHAIALNAPMWPDVYGSEEAISAADPKYLPSNVMELVENLINHGSDATLVEAVCRTLLSILRAPKAQDLFVAHGGVAPLLQIIRLYLKHINIIFAACTTASRVASNEVNALVLLEHDSITPMLRVLDEYPDDAELIAEVGKVLSQLLKPSSDTIKDKNHMLLLLNILKKHLSSMPVSTVACTVLTSFIQIHSLRPFFARLGGMELLVNAMAKHMPTGSADFARSACLTITSMTEAVTDAKLRDDMGAMPLILAALQRFGSVDAVMVAGCAAVRSLCDCAYQSAGTRAGFVPHMLKALPLCAHASAIIEICDCLGRLSLEAPAREACWKVGMLEVMNTVLAAHTADADVLGAVFRALFVLIRDDKKDLPRVPALRCARLLLDALKQHGKVLTGGPAACALIGLLARSGCHEMLFEHGAMGFFKDALRDHTLAWPAIVGVCLALTEIAKISHPSVPKQTLKHSMMPLLLQTLKACLNTTAMLACQISTTMQDLLRATDNNTEGLLEAGAVRVLFEALQIHRGDAEASVSLLHVIVVLATRNEDNGVRSAALQKALQGLDFLPLLVDLVKSHPSALRLVEDAGTVMHYLPAQPEMQPVKEEAVALFVDALRKHGDTRMGVLAAGMALAAVNQGSVCNALLERLGAIPLLVKGIKTHVHDALALDCMLEVLAEAATELPPVVATMAAAKCTPALLQALKLHMETTCVARPVCALLALLLKDATSEAKHTTTTTALMVKTLSHYIYTSSPIVNPACKIIAHFFDRPAFVAAACDAGLIPLLGKVVQKHNPEKSGYQCSCDMIKHLASIPAYHKALEKEGCAFSLLASLEEVIPFRFAEIATRAADTLLALARVPCRILEHDGIFILLAALQIFIDSPNTELKLMELLSRISENGICAKRLSDCGAIGFLHKVIETYPDTPLDVAATKCIGVMMNSITACIVTALSAPATAPTKQSKRK